MEAIIQGTISALGFLENDVYYQEPDCYETIRDLIRFLRNDNDVMLARRICGERNIIGNDLIPIIKSENVKGKMFDITLRLLVNLTQPAIVSLLGKHPEDRDEWQKYWILEENLRKAKPSFSDTKFFTVLKERLEMYFLETLWEDRLEEDRLRVRRFPISLDFWFFIMDSNKSVLGLRYTKASQAKERDFHLSILSIFALIFAEHNPSDIVVAGRQRTTAEKEKAEEELRQVVATEKTIYLSTSMSIMLMPFFVLISANICRSVFGSIGFRPIKSLGEVTFLDERKNKKVTAKNRRLFEGKLKTHTSSMDLRIKLKLFVEEILSSCFNRLMKSTKDLVYSDLHFFLLMQFLLEYNRLSGRASSEVSACVSIEAFHHVQVQISNYLESAVTIKKEAKQFGLRTQYSLSAYKELILFLQHLIENGSPEEKDLGHRTSYHILIVEEYREMGLAMFKKFSVTFLSKTYLSELILSTHHYLRLLQNAVKSGQLNTVKKRNKIRRRTARSKKVVIYSLFRKYAMLKVQRALREGRTKDAMGLYRSSRELWPADGTEVFSLSFITFPLCCFQVYLGILIAASKSLIFTIYYFRYVFLLNDFATNSVELNKALVKLLHRIAFDLDMPSRLFQLSLFRIFAQVRTYFEGVPKDDMRRNPLFELFNFGHHLLKKFFSCYGILEDKLAPEILFWKGPKECYEIQNGYVRLYSKCLEIEWHFLFFILVKITLMFSGMDVLDFIEPNLGRPCTRKQIYKKLKEFALDPLGARFLRARLTNNQGEEFSRRRILKQINYQGITYEKKKSDDSTSLLIDLVTYVMQRLSEKKPRRQVERELKALGANITPRNKSKPTKLIVLNIFLEQTRGVTLFFIPVKLTFRRILPPSEPRKVRLTAIYPKTLNQDFNHIEHRMASSHTHRFL
uniref:TIMELESS domain-containing protein n=1 Tax=Angiostrongylus cantonensis TaxID=6313 RepID=A0A158PC30_ANGCA